MKNVLTLRFQAKKTPACGKADGLDPLPACAKSACLHRHLRSASRCLLRKQLGKFLGRSENGVTAFFHARLDQGALQRCHAEDGQALRTLGLARFVGAVTMTFGALIAALGYPFFTLYAVVRIADGTLTRVATPVEALQAALGSVLLVAGCVAVLGPALVALRRRRLGQLLAYVPLLPLYYVLVSVAAWRGLGELLFDPFRWNKTEHGLARTSRCGLLTDAEADPARPPPPVGRG